MTVRRVFLSSTGADLKAYREAAFAALQKLDDWKVVRMEDFAARDWDVDTFCREQVRSCNLFIGVIGHRFGEGPKDSKTSFTQREYQAAVDAKRARLLYLAPDDFAVPANLREPEWKLDAQDAFRKQLAEGKDAILSIGFTNPDNLATKIATDVYNWDRQPSARRDATPYLTALREECAYIDIRGLKVGNESVYRFDIDKLYTPLTTLLASAEKVEERKPVPLQEALAQARVVLVGDPGAGKSTFLRRIAFAACKAHLGQDALDAANLLPRPCPFPILIRAATLAEFIRTHRCAADYPVDEHDPAWLTHFPGVGDQLGGDSLLMLDGLDEVADPVRRKSLARLLDRAARQYEPARIVATSRPPAYGGETVIPGFVTVQIGPLEEEAIRTFVENWCRALHGEGEKADALQSDLMDSIQSRPEIRDMAVNPVMLTALAALHWNRVRLPDQRSELYESVLDWLAKAKEEVRRTPPKQCLDLMQHLAYTMLSDPKGKQVEVTRYHAAQVLAPRFRDVPEDERHAAAEQFLEAEETDSGIVISRGNSLRYWHLTFQEYLAARALASRDEDRRRLLFDEGRLYQQDWRETVLLLAGVLCKQGQERIDGFLAEVLDGLGIDAALADRARCAGLIGLILQDLKSWNYRIADPRYQENLIHVLEIFESKGAREIDFQTRLEAAEALGQSGDPRLDQDNWVRVEGGEFWMGAQKTDKKGKNYDPQAYDDESPVHRVLVSPFYMGRYPVTVSEYVRFLEAQPAAAAPGHWQQQLRNPNRPVVEVSWHDAVAYCAWAGGRLPTEAEWECAARAGRESVRYPWGNQDPDAYRANFWEGGPKQPTPVGLYPDGATQNEIHDLAGNVYEWTADWWGDYPNPPEQGTSKVIRGGSCGNYARLLRVSGRDRSGPQGRNDVIGFRCVRELLSL